MIVLRSKVFSEKKDGETKLKALDRLEVWSNKHDDTDRKRKYLKGEISTPMKQRDAVILGAASGGPLVPIIGSPMTALADKNYKAAAVRSAIGASTQPVLNKAVGSYNKRKLKKNPHANDRKLDLIDVAEEKMSKEDFAKKWYKNKKESKKSK